VEKMDGVGDRINEIRVAKGMTMRALSLTSGLPESYLWRIVRGKIANLRLETIRKIACNGLDIPVSALFGEEGRVVININDNRPEWCRYESLAYRIAEIAHKLPTEAQELVLAQIKSLDTFLARPRKTRTKSTAVRVLKGEL
jgi:transcriptional regulator with XRE-family HTH domain